MNRNSKKGSKVGAIPKTHIYPADCQNVYFKLNSKMTGVKNHRVLRTIISSL